VYPIFFFVVFILKLAFQSFKEFGGVSPSHTSHVLQPLDVSCFKPFKIALKKERNNAMVKNNHCEPNKCTLTSWVDKSWD
jgi:hypothetical protein